MPLVFIKHITELITGNKSYYRGGRYRQFSLYDDGSVIVIQALMISTRLISYLHRERDNYKYFDFKTSKFATNEWNLLA